MKKITLVLVLFMSIFIGFTQSGLRLSLKGGAGLSSFYNSNVISDKDIMILPAIGYSLGAEIGWNARWYNYGITTGFYIRQYGNHYDNIGGSGLPDINNYMKLNGFEIPLMMRFRPSGDAITKQVTMGGAYFELGVMALLINQVSLKSSSSIAGDVNLDLTDRYQSMSGNVVVGFGSHQIGLEKFALTHGLRIHVNVLDITGDSFQGLSYNGNEYKPTLPVCIQYLMAVTLKFPTN